MMSSQWFHSRSTGLKMDEVLDLVDVHEEMEEMESVLVNDEDGTDIMFP